MTQDIMSIIKKNIKEVEKLDTVPDNYFLVKNNLFSIQHNKNFHIYNGNGFLYKNEEEFIGMYDFNLETKIYTVELFFSNTKEKFDKLEDAVYFLWNNRKDNQDIILL